MIALEINFIFATFLLSASWNQLLIDFGANLGSMLDQFWSHVDHFLGYVQVLFFAP